MARIVKRSGKRELSQIKFPSVNEVLAKIALNEKKYPIDLSKNNAVKYNRR